MADATRASTPEIKPNPEGAKANNDSGNQHPITINLPASIETKVSGKLEVKAEVHQADQHKHWYDEPDAWVAVFTGALVLVTAFLAAYTYKLWKATKRLVKDAGDTAKDELRAYVAIEHVYPRDTSIPGIDHTLAQHSLKVRVRNFGKTPAHQMTLWFKTIEYKPPEIGFNPDYPSDYQVTEPQMLHPTQEFNRIVDKNFVFSGEINKERGDDMGENYVFGRIVYRDIFENWWATCFCYEYEGGASFRAHGDYNKEQSHGKNSPF